MDKESKQLIFIPYQDSDNFYTDGILTREFAMLYSLYKYGYKKIINVKKPRTLLDKKNIKLNTEFYPNGTIENDVRKILEHSISIQYLPIIDIKQIMMRRAWWISGYHKTIKIIKLNLYQAKNSLIYSNNPFAVELLCFLKNKGYHIYFDIMDNFAIHPSLNNNERVIALESYKKIFKLADIISANSEQTCQYMSKFTDKNIILVKNGVFIENEMQNMIRINQVNIIRKQKKSYRICVGYIGKLGKRLDADLIEQVSKNLPYALFVFVGDCLKGQINNKLLKLFKERNNIIHLDAIPSAYVYSMLDEFDILSIPHSVGKNENGGDPLKLYQYLTRRKPIITTNILGVSEFSDFIKISNSVDEWIKYIKNVSEVKGYVNIQNFSWQVRLTPIIEEITKIKGF